jgi:hypothetical protein
MEVSGQHHRSVDLPPPPGTYLIGGWVGPRAGLNPVKDKIFWFCRKSKHDSSVIQDVASLIYGQRYICRMIISYRHFEGLQCLNLQGRTVKRLWLIHMLVKQWHVPILPVKKKESYDPFRNAWILDIFYIVTFCLVSVRLWEMHYGSYRKVKYSLCLVQHDAVKVHGGAKFVRNDF